MDLVLCAQNEFLIFFSTLLYAVSLSEQAAAGPWSLELSSSHQTNFVFILQEHLSLCYRGKKP